jgi:hypothetical protein
MKISKPLTVTATAAVLVTGLAATASADTGTRRCSGDVCTVKDISGGTTVLYAAAAGQRFYGHFRLGNGATSPTRWWYGGGLNGPSHWQVAVRTQRAAWCVTAWDARGTVCL